jgi:hypothetical protein
MIRKLSLTGWKQFETLTLEFSQPIVFIFGENEAGKSTIRDAVAFAWTGLVPGVSKKKDVPAVVIHEGGKAAEVILEDDDLTIERRVTTSGETLVVRIGQGDSAEAFSGTKAQAQLGQFLGLRADALEASIDTWAFVGMDAGAQRAELALRIAAERPTPEAIAEQLGAQGAEGPLVAEFSAVSHERGFPTATADAVKRRQEIGREIEALRALPPEGQHAQTRDGVIDLDAVTAEAIEEKIKGLESELEALANSTGAQRGRQEQHIREVEAKIRDLEIDAARDVPALKMIQAAIDAGQTDKVEADRVLAEQLAAIDPDVQAPPSAKIERPKLCPVIPHGFLCPASAQEIEAHRGVVKARAAEIGPKYEASEFAKAQASATRIRLQTINQKLDAQRAALTRAEAQHKARDEARQGLAQKREHLTAARAQLATLEDAQPGAMDELRRRLEIGRDVRTRKQRWDAYKAAKAAADARIVELEVQHGVADRIVKALPKIAELSAAAARQPLVDRLALTGSILGAVELDEHLDLIVVTPRGRRSWAQLSRSQRLRLGIVAQDLLSFRSHVPALVLDEVDTFDGERQAALVGVLRKLVGNPYPAVWVLATSDAERCPGIEGAEAFRMDGGQAVRLDV